MVTVVFVNMSRVETLPVWPLTFATGNSIPAASHVVPLNFRYCPLDFVAGSPIAPSSDAVITWESERIISAMTA